MYKKGSISVFLALISICIISLIMISLESARISGARWQAQNIADSSIYSLFSEYNIKLWEKYKIALLEYIDDEDIKESMFLYANANIDNTSNYLLFTPKFDIEQKLMIVDEKGAYIEKEIVDYMKYNISSIKKMLENPAKIIKEAKKADSGKKISDGFSEISKQAMDLEKYAKKICENLEKIKKNYDEASADINSQDMSSFQKEADDIIDEIKKLGKNFEKYKKESEKIDKKIKQASESESWNDVDGEQGLQEYNNSYKNYNIEQKKRLEEIKGVVEAYNMQLGNISDSKEIAASIEDLEADSDEEHDYSEEIDSLYETLESKWNSININSDIKASEIDEEKKQQLYDLKDLMNKKILSLVLPRDRKLSKLSHSQSPLEKESKGFRSRKQKQADIFKRAIIQEYIDEFFYDFIDDKSNLISYEKEYIIAGKNSDEKNLKEVLKQLLALRTGFNYLSLIRDSEKISQVKALANTIMGFCALPQLSFLLEFLILSVWAMAEAVIDIKLLLAGGEIPLFKNKGEFKLELENLFKFKEYLSGIEDNKKEEKKEIFTYSNYLKIIMLIQNQEKIDYRILDLLQMNMNNIGNFIDMKNMLYALQANMKINSSRFFSNFIYEKGYKFDEAFEMKIKCQKAY